MYRQLKGMSQEKLAKALNFATATISMWENGKREPDLQTTKRLADCLGIEVDKLIKPSSAEEFVQDKQMNLYNQLVMINSLAAQLNEAQQIQVIAYMRGMLAESERHLKNR